MLLLLRHGEAIPGSRSILEIVRSGTMIRHALDRANTIGTYGNRRPVATADSRVYIGRSEPEGTPLVRNGTGRTIFSGPPALRETKPAPLPWANGLSCPSMKHLAMRPPPVSFAPVGSGEFHTTSALTRPLGLGSTPAVSRPLAVADRHGRMQDAFRPIPSTHRSFLCLQDLTVLPKGSLELVEPHVVNGH